MPDAAAAAKVRVRDPPVPEAGVSADLVSRIRNRIHDAPMPTEHLLDEAEVEIERLKARLRWIIDVTRDDPPPGDGAGSDLGGSVRGAGGGAMSHWPVTLVILGMALGVLAIIHAVTGFEPDLVAVFCAAGGWIAGRASS
jgi:hypothetical protein